MATIDTYYFSCSLYQQLVVCLPNRRSLTPHRTRKISLKSESSRMLVTLMSAEIKIICWRKRHATRSEVILNELELLGLN